MVCVGVIQCIRDALKRRMYIETEIKGIPELV